MATTWTNILKVNNTAWTNIMNTVQQSTAISGIVAYYKLDTGSTSSVGSFTGTDTSMTYTSGKISNAGTFNGTTSKINLPVLGVSGGVARSISFWVKTTANGGGIYSSGPAVADQAFAVSVGSSGINNGTIDVSSFNGTGVRSSALVNDNIWHYVVVTYNGGAMNSTNCLIYVDGALTSSVGGSGVTNGSQNTNYAIGYWALTSGFYFTGQIDEMGIWNRVLTTVEVADLYSGGVGLTYPFILN